jgi:Ca2+-transporting ATPase
MSAAAVRKGLTPYQQPLEKVVAGLGADLRTGLTQAEARSRLERYGRNELTAKKPVPAWRKFLAQFQNPLVLLLLVATVISAALWLYERDSELPYEAIVIFAVVLLNAILGCVQEARAESAIAALR